MNLRGLWQVIPGHSFVLVDRSRHCIVLWQTGSPIVVKGSGQRVQLVVVLPSKRGFWGEDELTTSLISNNRFIKEDAGYLA